MRLANPANLKHERISAFTSVQSKRVFSRGRGVIKCDVLSRKFISPGVFESVFYFDALVIGVKNRVGASLPFASVSSFTVFKDEETTGIAYQTVAGTGFWKVTGAREFWVDSGSPVINLAEACRALWTTHSIQFDEENLNLISMWLNLKGYIFVGSIPIGDAYRYLQEIAWEHGLRCVNDGAIKFTILGGDSAIKLLASDNFKVSKVVQEEVERDSKTWAYEIPTLTGSPGGEIQIRSTQKLVQIQAVMSQRNSRKGVRYRVEGWLPSDSLNSNSTYLLAVQEVLVPGEFAGIYRPGSNIAFLGYQRFVNGVAIDSLAGVSIGDLVESNGGLMTVTGINPTTLGTPFDGVGVIRDNTPLFGANSVYGTFSLVDGIIVMTGVVSGGNFAYLLTEIKMSVEQSRSQQESSNLAKVTLYEE